MKYYRINELIKLVNEKKEYLRKNILSFLFLFGASVIGLVINIFTTPLFSKNMTAGDFAAVGYFSSITSFFSPLFSLLFYYYYSFEFFRKSAEDIKELLGNLIIFQFCWNLVFFWISYFIIFIFFDISRVSFPFFPLAMLSLVSLCIGTYKNFVQIKYRLEKKSFSFFLVAGGSKIVITAFALILVVYFQLGAVGKVGGSLIGEIIFFLITLYVIRDTMKFPIRFEVFKEALKFTWPIILGSLIFFPVSGFDIIILEKFNDTNELGLYSIGLTIASYLFAMNQAVFQTFEPDIINYAINRKWGKLKLLVIGVILFTFFSTVLFILLSKPLISYLTAGKYLGAVLYCKIFSIGLFFMIIISISSSILNAYKGTKYLFFTNLIGSFLSIVLYWLFSKLFGFHGTAFARIIIIAGMVLANCSFLYKTLKKQTVS